MSLYGDSTTIKGGRSSSEISIYDYPEHLNPFYEDENHKRIRFWKIGKNKKLAPNDGGTSRRNSFSFGGLKDMWAFKSFRPKKSSTLGINKTSESPPRIQVVDIRDTNYGTLDNKSRYSTGLNNGNGPQQFQRNIPYRSSLQDMRSNAYQTSPGVNHRIGIGNGAGGFGRNEMYRSTIQTPNRMHRTNNVLLRNNNQEMTTLQASDRRYVYGGSVTPQPKRYDNFFKNKYNDDREKLGSSQLSVASSTNPFEDDYDDDKENLNSTWHCEMRNEKSDGTIRTTNSLTRPYKKKRRAPPPPVTNPNVIEEESTKKDEVSSVNINVIQSSIITTNETSQQEHIITPEEKEISNLTAQIESFVNQTVEENSTEKSIPPTPPERKYFKENIIKTKNSNINEELQSEKPKILIIQEKEEKNFINEKQQQTSPMIIIHHEPKLLQKTNNRDITSTTEIITTTQTIETKPQKVIVHKTIVHKDEVNSMATTVPDGSNIYNNNNNNEKILNTHPKPVPTVRTSPKINNKPLIIEEFNTNIILSDTNTSSLSSSTSTSPTITTSPTKEKPPLSPKPNFIDIKIKNNDEKHFSNKKLNNIEENLNNSNSIELKNNNQVIAQQQQKQQSSSVNNNNNNNGIEICDYENTLPESGYELKITESTEDVSDEIANEIVSLPYIPLKSDSPTNNELIITKINNNDNNNNNSNLIKSSTSSSSSQNEINECVVELKEIKLDNNLINNIRPRAHFCDEEPEHRRPIKYERKKSVREIIESINKNQSLLKINNNNNNNNNNIQKDTELKTNNLGETELTNLDESQRNFKRLLSEIENYDCTKNNKINNENLNNNNNIAEIDVILNKIEQLNENENIFKKCTANHHINDNTTTTTITSTITTTTITRSLTSSRETSPTKSNLDWNPVPKPKRTKKLNTDLIIINSSSSDNNNNCHERLVE